MILQTNAEWKMEAEDITNELKQHLLLLFKSGINLLTRFGKTNPINFDKI